MSGPTSAAPVSSAGKHGWLIHSTRTAIGASASLGVATLCRLPAAYWAPITTLIVMESTLGAAWAVSQRRFIGTALGAAAGGILATYLSRSIFALAVAVFVLGLICGAVRLDRSAYRFAGITLFIVAVSQPSADPWLVALTRFADVSLGIAVGLAIAALWPENDR